MAELTSTTQSPTQLPWTPAILLERLGGDEELAMQLVALFIEECPAMMAAVRDSIASGSADKVRRAAHALKGSAGNFIDGPPVTTAYELEQIGAANAIDRAPAVFARLEHEIEQFLAALRRFQEGAHAGSDRG